MGPLYHREPPAAAPERSPRSGGDGAALPGAPLLLLFVLLASSISACKGEDDPAGSAFLGTSVGSGVPAACQRLGTASGIGLAGYSRMPVGLICPGKTLQELGE